ncbi:vesicular glutamate transporter 2.1-like isoform X2 [Homalodisca vitripennis]|uniref:vesicular glutamate transporter 2.1-like isoform X2 n=1 Tax=Homalodisca vitripennis TaxID=197043 RepID=UPI001EEB49A5|nr:vesicular glutamate transporter 2.1-like isoform X2 [Homalodisca vitripennis]
MDNLPRRRPTGFRRRHLVTVLAFLGIFIVENLRWTFVNAIEQIRTPYNVTLDNGKVVEKRNLNFDVLEIAHISSASFYGYVATQILGGWLGACLGGSRVFGVGVAFTALFSFVLPFVVHGGTAKSLITIRVIQGLFEGVTYPSIIAVWSRWAPPQERARLVTIAFSGGFFSFLVNPPVCRFIAYTLDWSFIFYITGILGLIWCAVWLTVVKDKPEDDPHISTEELKYLRDNLDCGPNDSVPKHIVYPWDEFVKSMPVWAIVVAHACTNYCFYSLVVGIPWFLRDTHNYQLDSTGLLSLLPYLMITVLMPVAGVLADWLRNAELLTTTHVRKTFICSTFISQAILIFLAAHLNSFNGTSLCLVLALGLTAFSWAAFSGCTSGSTRST